MDSAGIRFNWDLPVTGTVEQDRRNKTDKNNTAIEYIRLLMLAPLIFWILVCDTIHFLI